MIRWHHDLVRLSFGRAIIVVGVKLRYRRYDIIYHFPSLYQLKFGLGKNRKIEFLCRPYYRWVEKSCLSSSNLGYSGSILLPGKIVFSLPKFENFTFPFHSIFYFLLLLLFALGNLFLYNSIVLFFISLMQSTFQDKDTFLLIHHVISS